ncbi:hypothetical protein ACLRDC_15330 [Gluconacetobacter sacchari]|nr:hypothetical protein [Gluconacetobacter sacchari]
MLPEQRPELALLRGALSGAMAGYFLGWALAFRRRWKDESPIIA